MSFNHLKGEVEINLAGKNLILRPTFDAMCRIENSLGKSIITILCHFAEKGIYLEEIIEIIKISHISEPNALKTIEIRGLLEKSNALDVTEKICQFLKNGIGYID